MENTVYYTFSTISQSLAAMIALLGVFTIYMLQTLNSRIIDISQGYLEYLNKMEKDKNPNTGIWFVNRELNGLIISKNLKKIKAGDDHTGPEHRAAFSLSPVVTLLIRSSIITMPSRTGHPIFSSIYNLGFTEYEILL